MVTTVAVRNGRVMEFKDGRRLRSYGSNIVDASDNDNLVACISPDGKVHVYKNGLPKYLFGANASKVQVSGDTVVVTHSGGKITEYRNGQSVRSC